MKLDINNLTEVISKDDFHNLLNNIFKNKTLYSNSDLINYLDILGEKYGKFYDDNELTILEAENIHEILKEVSDFNRIDIMEQLVCILFKFRIDNYANFLKKELNSIKSEVVYNEINDALNEYEFMD